MRKMRAVTASEMFEIERLTRERYKIPSVILMENAGRAVAESIRNDAGSLTKKSIAIFCGKGNNGGDGFVAARYISGMSPRRIVIYIVSKSVKEGPAKINFDIVRRSGIQIRSVNEFLPTRKGEFDIGIDALFGIGFRGRLEARYSGLCAKINDSIKKIYAIDVPSGLDATTGTASKNSIRASMTVTFGLPKTGFSLNDGPRLCGKLVICNPGFPTSALFS